jgi:excisionase family DNA binding protein
MDGIAEKEILTTKEAAAYLSIRHATMLDWLQAGKVRGYKLGRHWRVKKADLLAVLKASGRDKS